MHSRRNWANCEEALRHIRYLVLLSIYFHLYIIFLLLLLLYVVVE